VSTPSETVTAPGPETETVSPNLRPARLSGALSVALALGAVASLGASDATPALAVEALGLAALVGGLALRRDRSRVGGAAIAVVGVGVVLGAVAFVWVATRDLLAILQFAPGMVGALALTLGVAPLRGRGSRRLVKAGTALVFLSVLAAAVVRKPALAPLLTGGVATVLAWDLGENAIGIGAQLGRRAETTQVELAHGLGSVAVGAAAFVTGRAVDGVGTPGLPLDVFALLLIGLVLLAGALHD